MYRKILVGTDGSKTAAKAVDRAVAIAGAAGARLTIVTVAALDRGRQVVDAEAARHAGAGIELDTMVIDDDPVAGLIEVARGGSYDLLVIGNRGMTGVSRFLRLGSVPNKITHHLPCSLLIVKTT